MVTRFLPAMMSIVVDDYTFTVEQKLPSEEKTSLTYPTTLPETFSRYLHHLMPLLNPEYSASAYFFLIMDGLFVLSRYIQENRVACEIGLYYALHIAKLRNKNALQRLLPGLGETPVRYVGLMDAQGRAAQRLTNLCVCVFAVDTYNDMAFGDIFLHLLTGHLTLLSDEFGSEEFCTAVFDNFLLTSFSRSVLSFLITLYSTNSLGFERKIY